MKRLHIAVVVFIATLTTLLLAIFSQAALAAEGCECPDAMPMETAAVRNAPAPRATQAANANSTLTLLVQTPAGSTFRLAYVPNDGWKLDDPGARLKPAEGRVTTAAASPPEEEPAANRPMTVFIDGPTGYTYVWIRDQGWKFVGRLTDRMQ
jgi:hypothetical protein